MGATLAFNWLIIGFLFVIVHKLILKLDDSFFDHRRPLKAFWPIRY